MKKGFKKLALSVALISCLFTTHAFAAQVDATSNKTKPILGYYPSIDSVGTRIITSAVAGQLDVGDIIAIPTDEKGTSFFNLFDKDGDPQLEIGSNKNYQVVWWYVKPKEGYKWADEPEAEDTNTVKDWAHVEATKIEQTHYIDVADVSTSKALRVPATAIGSRIAFSIMPETIYGAPSAGHALYAPDLNYFWKNTDANQKPGNPDITKILPDQPAGNGIAVERLGSNQNGGGNTIPGLKTYSAIIYENVKGDGVFDPENDKILRDDEEPKVNTTYVVDIVIYSEDGSTRSLTNQEKDSIVWEFYQGDDKIVDPEATKGSYSFKTQTTNADASETLRSTPPNNSQQGLSLMVHFSYDDGQPE